MSGIGFGIPGPRFPFIYIMEICGLNNLWCHFINDIDQVVSSLWAFMIYVFHNCIDIDYFLNLTTFGKHILGNYCKNKFCHFDSSAPDNPATIETGYPHGAGT